MNPIARRLIILGTPLILGILDLFHPNAPVSAYNGITPNVDWWIILHFIQLPLFCLLALSVYLLLDGIKGPMATLSRLALGLFVIFYPALDAILGLATGALVRASTESSAVQQAIVGSSLEELWNSPITELINTLGGLGWAIAILLAALAFSHPTWSRWFVIVPAALVGLAFFYFQAVNTYLIYEPLPIEHLSRLVLLLAIALGLAARPHVAVGLLVMAAYLFSVDHAPPTGPAAMACYFVAALQLEFFTRETTPIEKDVAQKDGGKNEVADKDVVEKDLADTNVVPG